VPKDVRIPRARMSAGEASIHSWQQCPMPYSSFLIEKPCDKGPYWLPYLLEALLRPVLT
jgi:hypothetical protein